MRDISIGIIDQKTGLATFAITNVAPVSGISLLVAKVTKKILSKSFSTNLFTYYGLDLQSIPYYGVGDNSIDTVHALLSSNLQNIATSIQNNTAKTATNAERLASLTLADVIYDKINHKIIAKISLTSVQGDTQTLLFPIGV